MTSRDTLLQYFPCAQEAFDWRIRKGQGPAPSLYDYEEEEGQEENTTAILENIDGELLLAQVGVVLEQ